MLFGFLVQYMHQQFIIAYMHFESLWRCASQNRVVLTVIIVSNSLLSLWSVSSCTACPWTCTHNNTMSYSQDESTEQNYVIQIRSLVCFESCNCDLRTRIRVIMYPHNDAVSPRKNADLPVYAG